MKPGTRPATLAILVLLVAGLAWFQRDDLVGHPPRPEDAALPSPTTTSAGTPAAPDSTVAATATPRWPADFQRLRERAESGDARAACQLGAKLLYCASMQMRLAHLDWAEAAERKHADAGNLVGANLWAEMLAHGLTVRPLCEGLPADAGRQGYDWVRRAALAGEPDAMLLHASGATLVPNTQEGWSFLADGRFEQWRAEAPAMLQARLEQGDPAAVLALLRGYQGDYYLGWILPPDPDRALALGALGRLVFSDPQSLPAGWTGRTITPVDFRAARAQAQRWHQAYFKGQPTAVADHAARLEAPLQRGPASRLPGNCDAQWGGS